MMPEDSVNIPINDYNGKSFQVGIPKSIAKQYKSGSDEEKGHAQEFIERAAQDYYHSNYEVPPEQRRHMGIHVHLPESIVSKEQRSNADKVADEWSSPEKEGPGVLSQLGSLAASPITGIMAIPQQLKDYFQGNIKPTGGFSSDDPTSQIFNNSMMSVLPPEPNATNLTNAGRMIKGGLKGGYDAAKSTVPFRGMNVPAVIPGALAGGWLGRDIAGNEGAGIGAALGGAAPIVKGVIQGAREAPRVYATPKPADSSFGPVIPKAPSNNPGLNLDAVTWPPKGTEAAPLDWFGSNPPITPIPPQSYKSYGSGKLSDVSPSAPTWPPQRSVGSEPAPLDWFGSEETPVRDIPKIEVKKPQDSVEDTGESKAEPNSITGEPPEKIHITHDTLYKLGEEMGGMFKPSAIARTLKKMGHDVEPSLYGDGSWEKPKNKESSPTELKHEEFMKELIPSILAKHPEWY